MGTDLRVPARLGTRIPAVPAGPRTEQEHAGLLLLLDGIYVGGPNVLPRVAMDRDAEYSVHAERVDHTLAELQGLVEEHEAALRRVRLFITPAPAPANHNT